MKTTSDYRILVVDDAPTNVQILSASVREKGYQVSVAVNGMQALERVDKLRPDLVLLDIVMPELDGIAVLERMKASAENRHIPVIMISALDEMEKVVRCIEMGAEDYLPKPFNPTLLHARLQACLEKKSLRDAEREHLRIIEETQHRLEKELGEAARYVRSILPDATSEPLCVDWRYQPSTELGGDAFGYHWIDPDHFAIYLLDVCGHGVGASLLSVTAINVIRSGALPNTDFRDPGAVLSGLNNAFLMERQNDMYFTLWYGVYHAPSRMLKYSGGGHPPALLLHPDGPGPAQSTQLRYPGMIIGAVEDVAYAAQAVEVPPGSTLLVLCDGCYEILDPQGDVMDFETFEQFMQENVTAPDALDRLLAWIQDRHGEGPLDDDFSIVRIQF